MSMRSKHDEIHDKYQHIATTKAGTRYERLAASVLKTLEEKNVVIHDLFLRGRSTHPHQIDVLVEVAGEKRRAIVECKDFDTDKVDLDVMMKMVALQVELKPDRAIVITTVGFTKPAIDVAREYGIEMAILRAVTEEDWDGRVRHIAIHVDVNIVQADNLAAPPLEQEVLTINVTAERIAELILDGLGENRIIWGDEISRPIDVKSREVQ